MTRKEKETIDAIYRSVKICYNPLIDLKLYLNLVGSFSIYCSDVKTFVGKIDNYVYSLAFLEWDEDLKILVDEQLKSISEFFENVLESLDKFDLEKEEKEKRKSVKFFLREKQRVFEITRNRGSNDKMNLKSNDKHAINIVESFQKVVIAERFATIVIELNSIRLSSIFNDVLRHYKNFKREFELQALDCVMADETFFDLIAMGYESIALKIDSYQKRSDVLGKKIIADKLEFYREKSLQIVERIKDRFNKKEER